MAAARANGNQAATEAMLCGGMLINRWRNSVKLFKEQNQSFFSTWNCPFIWLFYLFGWFLVIFYFSLQRYTIFFFFLGQSANQSLLFLSISLLKSTFTLNIYFGEDFFSSFFFLSFVSNSIFSLSNR